MRDAREIDQLSFDARFGAAEVQQQARTKIRSLAGEAGIRLTSIRPIYAARANGTLAGWTVPAMNIRGLAYEFCRAIIRAAIATKTGLFVVEIARSEMEYTDQRPDELAVMLLAAALREGYTGPLFLQGDHYKINPGKNGEGVDQEVQALERLIEESLTAGFYNIDIDASTTVDLSLATPIEQQRLNAELTARLTKFIRQHQPSGVDVAVGGEIGEIGGTVSTISDLQAFMEGYRAQVGAEEGIGKVAIQTGTSHGGKPQPDGRVAPVSVDLEAVVALGEAARAEFGLAGVVQHGASTLPADQFHRFVEAGCLEIHLSTEFQNLVLAHPSFPSELLGQMHAYLSATWSAERTAGMTDAQFFYKTRKRAWGPFKRQLAELPEANRKVLGDALQAKITTLFQDLGVTGSRSIVERYIS